MALQSRTPKYGLGRHYPESAVGHRRLTLLQTAVKNGGITGKVIDGTGGKPPHASFPEKEIRKDYFPGIGEFEVKTFHVPITLGDLEFQLECGRLPEMLGLTLSLIGVEGILGNEFFREIKLGYLPRRKQIVLL